MPFRFTAETLMSYLEDVFPQIRGEFAIEALEEGQIEVRLKVQERHLRPGGTVSGPAMFALADVSVYMSVLAAIGPKELAVTTNASLDFMRKPDAGRDLIAHCKVLKLGRLLAVCDVLIYSEGKAEPVARASMTYALPPAETSKTN